MTMKRLMTMALILLPWWGMAQSISDFNNGDKVALKGKLVSQGPGGGTFTDIYAVFGINSSGQTAVVIGEFSSQDAISLLSRGGYSVLEVQKQRRPIDYTISKLYDRRSSDFIALETKWSFTTLEDGNIDMTLRHTESRIKESMDLGGHDPDGPFKMAQWSWCCPGNTTTCYSSREECNAQTGCTPSCVKYRL